MSTDGVAPQRTNQEITKEIDSERATPSVRTENSLSKSVSGTSELENVLRCQNRALSEVRNATDNMASFTEMSKVTFPRLNQACANYSTRLAHIKHDLTSIFLRIRKLRASLALVSLNNDQIGNPTNPISINNDDDKTDDENKNNDKDE